MKDAILTLREVAVLLKLSEKIIYAMTQERKFSAFQVPALWRVKLDVVSACTDERKPAAKAHIATGASDV
jgi:hypothetical protein